MESFIGSGKEIKSMVVGSMEHGLVKTEKSSVLSLFNPGFHLDLDEVCKCGRLAPFTKIIGHRNNRTYVNFTDNLIGVEVLEIVDCILTEQSSASFEKCHQLTKLILQNCSFLSGVLVLPKNCAFVQIISDSEAIIQFDIRSTSLLTLRLEGMAKYACLSGHIKKIELILPFGDLSILLEQFKNFFCLADYFDIATIPAEEETPAILRQIGSPDQLSSAVEKFQQLKVKSLKLSSKMIIAFGFNIPAHLRHNLSFPVEDLKPFHQQLPPRISKK